ncbi:PREDICTED: plant UBX domain-containing protein 16-like [Camelina sativa]|uniref:Plant UBX domain-containing protein 16-like n=1 Tax=Camelina sativa TaxID=90675 RepID=A0ABM0V358_CAMSA|nr:PREDICTED: plant UBX domain-containing protein 16-like [Camelina sativa]
MEPSFSNQERVLTTREQLDGTMDLWQDQLISSFLEIAVGQTTETARGFLQTSGWNINEAIDLFLITNNNNSDSFTYHDNHEVQDRATSGTYDSSNSDEDSSNSDEESDSDLSSSYSPPSYILQEGYFEDMKSFSSEKNRWLIVNLQSRTESASHTLNEDVWSNYVIARAVESNFILWQVYNDTIEGQKISSFYKIESAPPVVLVIDPITGQKMGMWSGVIEYDSLYEELMKFTDAGPQEYIASLIRNMRTETTETCLSSNIAYETPAPSWGEEFEGKEDTWSSSNNNNNQVADPSLEQEYEDEDAWETRSSCSNNSDDFVPPFIGEEYAESDEACLEFPVLTEEPKGDCDPSVLCSLCIRFPDGRRKPRKFLKSEPIQLLWSFCYSNMDESEKKAFKLVQAIPGASKTLDYGADTTFDQSGLANSMISVTWE